MFALISLLTYPYVPGKYRMDNNQASFFVITCLILYLLAVEGVKSFSKDFANL